MAHHTFTPQTSPVEQAWQLIKSDGTRAEITTGATYFARSRFADVLTLAERVAARRPVLSIVRTAA